MHALTSLVEEVSMNTTNDTVKGISMKLLKAFEVQKASP